MAGGPPHEQQGGITDGIGRRGGQRRSQSVGRLVVAVVLGIAGLVGIAYGIYDYVEGAEDAASEGSQLAGSIAAVGMGLVALLAAIFICVQARPPSARNYRLEADQAEARRGESVAVSLSVARPERVGEDAAVGLVCREYYEVTRSGANGGTDSETEDTVVHEEWKPIDTAQSTQRYVFEVPGSAPYSHEGSVVSFEWRIAARERRSMRPDARTEIPLWVRP